MVGRRASMFGCSISRCALALTMAWGGFARAGAQPLVPPMPPANTEVGDTPRFSLGDALRLMRVSHPAIRSRENEIAARRGDAKDAGLWTNPVTHGTYLKGIVHSSYDPLGYLYYDVTQFVELSNVPGERRRQSNLLVAASRADREGVVAQLSLDVESALIDLVAAHRTQELLTGVLTLLDSAGRIVNERVAAGAAPRYDATRIAVTLAIAHADQAESGAALTRAWAEFRAAVGPRARELQGDPDYDLNVEVALPDVPSLLQHMQARRPDVAAARAREAAAKTGIGVAQRSVFPGLEVGLAGGYGAASKQVDFGALVSLPLPVVNVGQGAIPAAKARAREAAADVDAIVVPASERIDGIQHEVLRRRQALKEYQARGVASNEEMLNEAQAGYVAGRFSILELADAYRAFRDARLREIALGQSARQSEIDLGRELGRPLREF
ncbi:MAG: TolC family protein [Myxococcales bacterium]